MIDENKSDGYFCNNCSHFTKKTWSHGKCDFKSWMIIGNKLRCNKFVNAVIDISSKDKTENEVD